MAPAFGGDAIDAGAFRRQTIAAGDIVLALDDATRDQIADGYLADRASRSAGAPVGSDDEPPEIAPD